MRIVIPGGSGQAGGILARHFHRFGHAVTVLSRHGGRAPWRIVEWDGQSAGAWCVELERADLVINLAGRSVNCRYTERNRREILESRVQATEAIAQAIAAATHPAAIWMNASTATIYRHSVDRAMNEADGELGGSEPGAPDSWRFSIDVAKRWEQAFYAAETPHTRKLALRSAMIMSPDRGGIFDALLGLVRRGLGGTAASGAQFVSWIHHVDFIRAIEFLVAHTELDGPVNICAPEPLPNCDFMRALREAWGAPIGLRAFRWMLELGAVAMRTETELILKSRRVVPGRLMIAGFDFQFPQWPAAARDLVLAGRSPFPVWDTSSLE